MLTDILETSESSAVVSLQEFAYKHFDFANRVTNEDLRLEINKFNKLGPELYSAIKQKISIVIICTSKTAESLCYLQTMQRNLLLQSLSNNET